MVVELNEQGQFSEIYIEIWSKDAIFVNIKKKILFVKIWFCKWNANVTTLQTEEHLLLVDQLNYLM